MVSEQEKLESAKREIEALKQEINELRESQSNNTSYAWIWLAFILFFGCLLMGNIALDYKNEYDNAMEAIGKQMPDSVATHLSLVQNP